MNSTSDMNSQTDSYEPNSDSESNFDGSLSSNLDDTSDSDSDLDSDSNSNSIVESDFESDSELTDYQSEIGYIVGINQPTLSESSIPLLFYVKFKDKSYRSCQWLTKEEMHLTKKGTLIYTLFTNKRTTFEQLKSFNTNDLFSANEEFNLYIPISSKFDEGFVTPELVISSRRKSGKKTQYLVKWLSLELDQSTWENEEDVPAELVEEFEQRIKNPHPKNYNPRNNKKAVQFEPFKESPSFKDENKLTDYQVEGLNWLLMCWFQRKNSILADEMGLGKTIESISVLVCLSKWYSSWGPFLVVCPLSTVPNWISEFKKWSNFRVVTLMGNKESRKITKERLIYHKNRKRVIFDVLIVSYEWLSMELKFIRQFNFMYTIIDEAQRIKNAGSSIYRNCQSIHSHHFLLMTGTPIQNNLFEIWSLLHFIVPSEFEDYKDFESKYIDKENPETIEKLQEVLQPYIFRRKKNDVNLDLPEKEEIIVEVEMTQIQRTFSQLFYNDTFGVLNDSLSKSSLNNIMMQLRKLYCHPFLFPNLESICHSQYRDSNHIPYDTPLSAEDEIKSLVLASGKTILIDKLLPKLKEGNHKVLIFSQFTSVLDILEDYLSYKRYSYERLDGNCSTTKRSRSIDKFQNDEETFIFLLSTRAGGIGINLTKADTVIVYDSDWNPQNDIQAQARCHRIGQTRKVDIYRLITRGSYESEMFERASKKLALDYAILDSTPKGKDDEKENSINNKKELEMILKKGAYYTFNDKSDEIDKFCSENIDQILERRSHTRKDVVSGGKSKFSKASFEAITEADILKDDFWDKLISNQNSNENSDKKSNLSTGIITRRKKKINYSDTPIKPEKEKKIDDDNANDTSLNLSDLNVTDFCNFNLFFITVDKSVYQQAISLLRRHGIGSSRFFTSEFVQNICKTLIIFLFFRISKKYRYKYYTYIKQFIPDFSEQINKTPFKEFADVDFMNSLFKGKESKILKEAFIWDVYYKVALYITNEKLPEKFQFAPEMPTYPGWTAIEDFVSVTSFIFSEKQTNFVLNENLPFKNMIKKNPSMKEWIFSRIKIIVSEVNDLIPESFSIFESGSKLKKIGDIEKFSQLNKHILYPKKLTIDIQKKLLRIFYFYGIPKKNGIKKIKEILKSQYISEEMILIFTAKLLISALKYQPNLRELLKSLPNFNSDLIYKNDQVDIRWIKEDAIKAVSSNLELIYRVRENFSCFNSAEQKNIETQLQKSNEINKKYAWWDFQCDVALFNVTAYYGFLFNSMTCHFLKTNKIFETINEKDILYWREQETSNLSPIIIEKVKFVEPIFSFEMKKKRISQIMDAIQIDRELED